MAFILVFILLKMRAYSLTQCQIVLLHVQSKRRPSKAALQPLHAYGHSFFIFFSTFWREISSASLSCDKASNSAGAK
jgi:hypothetical protein